MMQHNPLAIFDNLNWKKSYFGSSGPWLESEKTQRQLLTSGELPVFSIGNRYEKSVTMRQSGLPGLGSREQTVPLLFSRIRQCWVMIFSSLMNTR